MTYAGYLIQPSVDDLVDVHSGSVIYGGLGASMLREPIYSLPGHANYVAGQGAFGQVVQSLLICSLRGRLGIDMRGGRLLGGRWMW